MSKVYHLLAGAIATGYGSAIELAPQEPPKQSVSKGFAGQVSVVEAAAQLLGKAFHSFITGTGSVAATIVIEGSNSLAAPIWVPVATISLSGASPQVDGTTLSSPWEFTRAHVTAISGTGAAVSCDMVACNVPGGSTGATGPQGPQGIPGTP